MQVTFTAKSYKPELIRRRYVSYVPGTTAYYAWSEVGEDRRYDLRQGTCLPHELPALARERVEALRGQMFGAVELPLSWNFKADTPRPPR